MMDDDSSASSIASSTSQTAPELIGTPSVEDWGDSVVQDGGKTPFVAFTNRRRLGMDTMDVFGLFQLYNYHLASHGYCYNVDRKRKLHCDCLCVLGAEGEDGISY
jgi:hypothetical protein